MCSHCGNIASTYNVVFFVFLVSKKMRMFWYGLPCDLVRYIRISWRVDPIGLIFGYVVDIRITSKASKYQGGGSKNVGVRRRSLILTDYRLKYAAHWIKRFRLLAELDNYHHGDGARVFLPAKRSMFMLL